MATVSQLLDNFGHPPTEILVDWGWQLRAEALRRQTWANEESDTDHSGQEDRVISPTTRAAVASPQEKSRDRTCLLDSDRWDHLRVDSSSQLLHIESLSDSALHAALSDVRDLWHRSITRDHDTMLTIGFAEPTSLGPDPLMAVALEDSNDPPVARRSPSNRPANSQSAGPTVSGRCACLPCWRHAFYW